MHTRTPDTILEDEGVFTFPSFQSVWRNSIGFPPLFCSSTCCWWCGWRALLTSWSKLAGTPRWLSIESFYPHIVYTQENFTLLAAIVFFFIFFILRIELYRVTTDDASSSVLHNIDVSTLWGAETCLSASLIRILYVDVQGAGWTSELKRDCQLMLTASEWLSMYSIIINRSLETIKAIVYSPLWNFQSLMEETSFWFPSVCHGRTDNRTRYNKRDGNNVYICFPFFSLENLTNA